ncbi:hypothetical protein KN1_27990 [Stygiolobus caldivivus]|uniref:Uncharacterized protein n=1 Tax=Stygiolobus caldivivus TaxID=2824673 RepID=A0A8D5U936_9CREN|nr:hypothetical protein KN1_27990 [Stygiolobus caldivivus]
MVEEVSVAPGEIEQIVDRAVNRKGLWAPQGT